MMSSIIRKQALDTLIFASPHELETDFKDSAKVLHTLKREVIEAKKAYATATDKDEAQRRIKNLEFQVEGASRSNLLIGALRAMEGAHVFEPIQPVVDFFGVHGSSVIGDFSAFLRTAQHKELMKLEDARMSMAPLAAVHLPRP
jgi:hypothetical protein